MVFAGPVANRIRVWSGNSQSITTGSGRKRTVRPFDFARESLSKPHPFLQALCFEEEEKPFDKLWANGG
jgi:hypothetical protein